MISTFLTEKFDETINFVLANFFSFEETNDLTIDHEEEKSNTVFTFDVPLLSCRGAKGRIRFCI